MRASSWPSLRASWKFWPAVHLATYSIVPMHLRVLYIDVVDTMDGVRAFADKLRRGGNARHAVTLFAFSDYFPAVATTDVLSRVTAVLACKPSELAFYPVPKMMIRRVGDHEEFSARRASEVSKLLTC